MMRTPPGTGTSAPPVTWLTAATKVGCCSARLPIARAHAERERAKSLTVRHFETLEAGSVLGGNRLDRAATVENRDGERLEPLAARMSERFGDDGLGGGQGEFGHDIFLS